MTHPTNEPRNILRRVNRARNFPINTCPASRHLQIMAECLLSGGYPQLQEEPEHCAASILSVVESLYKARTKIEKLERQLAEKAA